MRLDPARKEILLEVDKGSTAVNNVPAGGLSGVLDGASKVFSNATPGAARGAGIYMYYLMDETFLDLTKLKVNNATKMTTELKNARDTEQARTTATPNLTAHFLHLIFVDDMGNFDNGASTYDKGLDLAMRGSMLALTDLKNNQVLWGLDALKFNEMLSCTTAHEITHLLIDRETNPFDSHEHTIDQNDATYLMRGGPATRARFELATVRFLRIVQVELRTRTNQAMVI